MNRMNNTRALFILFSFPEKKSMVLEYILVLVSVYLTLNLLTTTIVAPPSNASKWQMGFNSAFKGLSAFAKFRPANVSFPASVSLSAVRTKPLGSHWTDFPENMYLGLQLK